MIKLKKVTIHKYKCFETDQSFEIEDDISILVGMNESGKTSILEAIAKTNYFEKDEDFSFNLTHDYPRREKKAIEKSGNTPNAITCKFYISDKLINDINENLGGNFVLGNCLTKIHKYSGKNTLLSYPSIDSEKILQSINPNLIPLLKDIKDISNFQKIIPSEENKITKEDLEKVSKFYKNDWKWADPFSEYLVRDLISPYLPKYLYYDEYYSLPSRISINKLESKKLESNELKTAKALFELADINTKELLNSDSFEDFKAELEATQALISDQLFTYWTNNKNLDIKFDIEKIEIKTNPNQQIIEHILNIRVWNNRFKMSLPLSNRSKGFNWFFSFLVWFTKIQEDKSSNYILLLDEPGLNLHASAQKDLLSFIESLTEDYQILYTTHSPFMVPPDKLHRVRTVVDTEKGSKISDSLQEKDPNTLFPLQAALGYDIAQNLYISKNNLLVEGISDLIYLQTLSGVLIKDGREGLSEDITIIPTGGLDKVATFVSLLRGNDLNIVCLLDSTIKQNDAQKLERLIKERIIHDKKIVYYKNFTNLDKEADVEDMFSVKEYLEYYNNSIDNKERELTENDIINLKDNSDRIIHKITILSDKKRFNHYIPANYLLKNKTSGEDFSEETLERFENLFKEVNKLMNI